MHIFYYIALAIASGIVISKILDRFNLPNVTAYLIAGLLIGPYITGIIPIEVEHGLSVFTDVALVFISYSIGSQINFKELKRVGIGIVVLTIFEALGAMFLVTFVMLFIFKTSFAFALLIGSIASATAPPATMMVIKQYKAKGDVVDNLLPVVAMDDCVSIIAFGVALAISKTLLSGAELNLFQLLVVPFVEIIGSLVLGVLLSIVFLKIEKSAKSEGELMNFILVLVFIGYSVATRVHFSSLLTCMAIGATISNLRAGKIKYFSIIDKISVPIFLLFFVVSGADLDINALKMTWAMALFYVIARILGKWSGVYISAGIFKFPKNVQKYLGLTLTPQAGVAIGLTLLAQEVLPKDQGDSLRTLVLASTVICEFIGPLLTKQALVMAGEIELPKHKVVPKTV